MNNIELKERIYISEYLEELKESIQKIFEKYDIKYFKNFEESLLFFNVQNKTVIRAFYGSYKRYISLDLWDESYIHTNDDRKLIKIYFSGLQNKTLWIDGTYFEYIVNEIVKLFKERIKVVN